MAKRAGKRIDQLHLDRLLTIIVVAALAIIAFVVAVGGLVCLFNPKTYPFSAYLQDLNQLSKYLIAAIIALAIKFGAVIWASHGNRRSAGPAGGRRKTDPEQPVSSPSEPS